MLTGYIHYFNFRLGIELEAKWFNSGRALEIKGATVASACCEGKC